MIKTPKQNRYLIKSTINFIGLVFFKVVYAGELSVQVTDIQGAPLSNAVVTIYSDTIKMLPKGLTIEIEQKGKQFNPQVAVVQTGTSINFPNNDRVKHHVYSFSPAKKFELKLYSGVPSAPVVFDQPGTVVLGCNIHDKMLAYVYVVETPYFAKADQSGLAKIINIPNGDYEVKVWHYALKSQTTPVVKMVTLEESQKLVFALDINAGALLAD